MTGKTSIDAGEGHETKMIGAEWGVGAKRL